MSAHHAGSKRFPQQACYGNIRSLWRTGHSFLDFLFSNMEDTDANSPTPEEQPAKPDADRDGVPAPAEPLEVPVPESATSAPHPPDHAPLSIAADEPIAPEVAGITAE